MKSTAWLPSQVDDPQRLPLPARRATTARAPSTTSSCTIAPPSASSLAPEQVVVDVLVRAPALRRREADRIVGAGRRAAPGRQRGARVPGAGPIVERMRHVHDRRRARRDRRAAARARPAPGRAASSSSLPSGSTRTPRRIRLPAGRGAEPCFAIATGIGRARSDGAVRAATEEALAAAVVVPQKSVVLAAGVLEHRHQRAAHVARGAGSRRRGTRSTAPSRCRRALRRSAGCSALQTTRPAHASPSRFVMRSRAPRGRRRAA